MSAYVLPHWGILYDKVLTILFTFANTSLVYQALIILLMLSLPVQGSCLGILFLCGVVCLLNLQVFCLRLSCILKALF